MIRALRTPVRTRAIPRRKDSIRSSAFSAKRLRIESSGCAPPRLHFPSSPGWRCRSTLLTSILRTANVSPESGGKDSSLIESSFIFKEKSPAFAPKRTLVL